MQPVQGPVTVSAAWSTICVSASSTNLGTGQQLLLPSARCMTLRPTSVCFYTTAVHGRHQQYANTGLYCSNKASITKACHSAVTLAAPQLYPTPSTHLPPISLTLLQCVVMQLG